MRVFSRELGEFATNCYIIACEETGKCVVVDPGQFDPWIKRTIADNGLKPSAIVLTHGHLDHIGGVAGLKSQTGAPVCIHSGDVPMLSDARLNGSAFFGAPVTAPPPDRVLKEDDVIAFGSIELDVIHTPGHTAGGVCFYTPGHLFAGDTLFAGSIGRTDLAGGNFEQLMSSIREKLLTLPKETIVYPGHGPTTTIGDEAEYNPFL